MYGKAIGEEIGKNCLCIQDRPGDLALSHNWPKAKDIRAEIPAPIEGQYIRSMKLYKRENNVFAV